VTRIIRFAALFAIATLVFAIGQTGAPVTAGPNSLLDRANGHPSLSQGGKGLPHPSGGSEVTFDDERALMSDAQASSDGAPDATVSALGCANRGSATNPRVNQDCTLRRQAEEQVAVNPVDPTNVIAGQNDSRVGFNHCGFDYSLDGGTTWGDGQPPFFQHISLAGHTYDAASDPAVTFDGNGRAWYSCVVFDINTNASGLFVTRSTPTLKGAAYSNIGAGPSAFVVAEAVAGDHFFDKEFIAGDMRATHTEVYVTFTDFQSNPSCKKSFNKGGFCQSPIQISKWTGSAWTAPVTISGSSTALCVGGSTFNPQIPGNSCNFNQGSYPVVLSNGDVYVVFSNFNTPTLVNQQLGVKVHFSGSNATVSAPVRVGLDDENGAALCDFGRGPEQCVESLNVRSNDFPALAVDPTNASHLAATWTDTRANPAPGTGKYNIVVSESTDGGLTWSDASGGGTVLTTSGAYFEPSVAITHSSGKVVVSTYRANTALHTSTVGDGTFGYGYLVKTGTAFGSYTNASDSQANQSPQANAAQRGFLGDYSSIASAPGSDTVYMVWSDTRNSNASGPDEDVFVFKVTIP
jgi:hypothetical protein